LLCAVGMYDASALPDGRVELDKTARR